MGFLKDRAQGKEDDPENDPAKKEEDYEKMYMKIGRDFLHKDDFAHMMREFIDDLILVFPPFAFLKGLDFNFESNSSALARAKEYKALLDSGKDASSIYKDLIIIDDDEEDD